MIQLTNVSKEFGDRLLFYDMTFSLSKGEKVGLVGRNGTGKSTLLRMITKELSLDAGEINYPKSYKISFLNQFINFTEDTILKECAKSLGEDEKYDLYKAEKILAGLGFTETDFHKHPDTFSGGYQVRIQLTKCLLGNPNLLLLDEPTNYLDIVSLRWFQKFLKSFKSEIILITHDRNFMNQVVTHTMGIHNQSLKKIKGDYQKYKFQIEEEKRVLDNQRSNQERKRKQIEEFVNKFRAKARQASLANSRKKMLEKMEEFDQMNDASNLDFKFNFKEFHAKSYLELKEISFSYNESKEILKDFSLYVNKNDKIAIIGKNGKGKSTLLNLIAGNLKVKSGDIKFHDETSIGYFGQTNIDRLHPSNTIEQEILSVNPSLTYTRIRNVCGTMMFSGDDAKKSISVLSGGERSRVLLGKILMQSSNLLLLDEPTNHLDQESVEALSLELEKFKGGSLFVTHNESLIRKVANKLIVFRKNTIEVFEGNYDEFLERVGWDDEQEVMETKVKKLGQKELQKIKSELKREFNKDSKPVKKKIEELEEEIERLESENKLYEKDLIEASESQNGSLITKFSKAISHNESEVETLIDDLSLYYDQLAGLEEGLKKKIESYE